MKLGIYMGSFNPPHLGHKKIIDYLLENKIVDNILIVPTNSYWDKNNLIDISDRINMLKFYTSEHVFLDTEDYELVYTIDLLNKLKSKYSSYELLPIIGADNIISFHKWKNYKELLKYRIIIMNRDNLDIKPYLERLDSENIIVLTDFPNIKISSSELREKMNSEYLHPKVLKYIQKNHLYEK